MSKPSLKYFLFITSVFVWAGIGYGFYLLYPRFSLPVLIGIPLVLLATAAGLASFFSPCSFPLLLTLLARQGDKSARTLPPWRFAMGLSAGASLLMMLLGGFFLAGGIAISRTITFGSPPGIILRFSVGVILVWLGTVQIGWFSDRLFRWVRQNVTPGLREDDPGRSITTMVWYGAGYVLAGFG